MHTSQHVVLHAIDNMTQITAVNDTKTHRYIGSVSRTRVIVAGLVAVMNLVNALCSGRPKPKQSAIHQTENIRIIQRIVSLATTAIGLHSP